MPAHSRLWTVLKAGVDAGVPLPHRAPVSTNGLGQKRGRQEDLDQPQSPPASEEDASDDLLLEPNDLLMDSDDPMSSEMRLKITVLPNWTPEERDFSHDFVYSNVPVVRNNNDWQIPEFRLTNEAARVVEVTGSLNAILAQLIDGTSGAPSLLNRAHYSLHLLACRSALSENELLNNLDSRFHKHVREGDQEIINLAFVYNCISNDSDSESIVDAAELNALGLSDINIFRFWHQLRALLEALMDSTAETVDGGPPARVGEFVARLTAEVDPRAQSVVSVNW